MEVFRRDLLMANLGDGYAGFDFPIALADGQDVASVVIRLEHCDAAILQAGTVVVRSQPDAGALPARQAAAGKVLAMARA